MYEGEPRCRRRRAQLALCICPVHGANAPAGAAGILCAAGDYTAVSPSVGIVGSALSCACGSHVCLCVARHQFERYSRGSSIRGCGAGTLPRAGASAAQTSQHR
jgi:hypothetical protein